MAGKYKIVYTNSSRKDMRQMRNYIVKTFKYREYGVNFSKKIKEGVNKIADAPLGYQQIELEYRGYDIRMLVHKTYLLFYIVDFRQRSITILRILQGGMDWMRIIKKWLREHEEDE